MLPLGSPDRIHVAFDDHRLVTNAGLLLPVTLGGVVKRVCSRSSLPGVGKWPGTTPLSWHNGSPLRATA